jgi:hypothetical protein
VYVFTYDHGSWGRYTKSAACLWQTEEMALPHIIPPGTASHLCWPLQWPATLHTGSVTAKAWLCIHHKHINTHPLASVCPGAMECDWQEL